MSQQDSNIKAPFMAGHWNAPKPVKPLSDEELIQSYKGGTIWLQSPRYNAWWEDNFGNKPKFSSQFESCGHYEFTVKGDTLYCHKCKVYLKRKPEFD